MTERPVTYTGVVYPRECDHLGHMNVASYVAKFDQATWTLFARFGVDRAYVEGRKRAFVAVDQRVQYLRELMAGDTVEVRSVMHHIGGKTIRFTHEMVNLGTGEVAATTELTGVYMDTEGRKAAEIPETLIAAAQPLMAEDA